MLIYFVQKKTYKYKYINMYVFDIQFIECTYILN